MKLELLSVSLSLPLEGSRDKKKKACSLAEAWSRLRGDVGTTKPLPSLPSLNDGGGNALPQCEQQTFYVLCWFLAEHVGFIPCAILRSSLLAARLTDSSVVLWLLSASRIIQNNELNLWCWKTFQHTLSGLLKVVVLINFDHWPKFILADLLHQRSPQRVSKKKKEINIITKQLI